MGGHLKILEQNPLQKLKSELNPKNSNHIHSIVRVNFRVGIRVNFRRKLRREIILQKGVCLTNFGIGIGHGKNDVLMQSMATLYRNSETNFLKE